MTTVQCYCIASGRALRALWLTKFTATVFTLTVFTLLILMLTLALPFHPSAIVKAATPLEPTAPYATIITVDTIDDLNTTNQNTTTCTYDQGALFVSAVDGCTLRRAILEAAARPPGDRPIAITFDLPPASMIAPGVWIVPVNSALPALKTPSILDIDGQVTIDGSTQTGGRTTGPKIIINTDGAFLGLGGFGLEVESENNVIANLAFIGGGGVVFKEDSNTARGLWMGLTVDGQEVNFRFGHPLGMAGGGIDIRSDNNLVENNTIAGASFKAINIGLGNNNIVQNNLIGTRADGTVPLVPEGTKCLASFSQDPADWYGGWGISLSGSNNQILNNRIAGLQNVRSTNDTPPLAIETFGTGHLISGNIIGVDSANNEVGVCGQGIKVSSTDTQIVDNQVIGSRPGFEDDALTAIMGSGPPSAFNGVTVRRNIVKDGPGNVYAFGPGVASALRTFNPARITSISGTTIQGTAGDGSPCPNCVVDFYSDDSDTVGEALTFLGTTTADASGNFSFVMAQPLAAGTGIRTNSTTAASNIIPGFAQGTTTKTSRLYLAMAALNISGPANGELATSYLFTATVAPSAATQPIDFTIAATDKPAQTVANVQGTAIEGTFNWDTAGVKTITVTAQNELSTVIGTHNITITDPRKAVQGVAIAGPTSGLVNSSYTYTFTVSPDDVTVPLNYSVSATDQTAKTVTETPSKVASTTYSWTTPGTKTITVTVENEVGSITNTLEVTIAASSAEGDVLFLPKLQK